LAARLGAAAGGVVPTLATIGGGSLPGDTVPSFAVVVDTTRPDATARRLRVGEPAVVGRIEDDRLLVDLRTVDPVDEDVLVEAIRAAVGRS
jgi:L-seryl-tRNA(Ser) seleniumtransferase